MTLVTEHKKWDPERGPHKPIAAKQRANSFKKMACQPSFDSSLDFARDSLRMSGGSRRVGWSHLRSWRSYGGQGAHARPITGKTLLLKISNDYKTYRHNVACKII
jgi:hypothetical protein